MAPPTKKPGGGLVPGSTHAGPLIAPSVPMEASGGRTPFQELTDRVAGIEAVLHEIVARLSAREPESKDGLTALARLEARLVEDGARGQRWALVPCVELPPLRSWVVVAADVGGLVAGRVEAHRGHRAEVNCGRHGVLLARAERICVAPEGFGV